ncbi:sulfite exporter TauE/SafE family protein [Desertivirga brevis]|uniref:sulfite exporter TauE/SafE family protein n=1 Tax=Desertivirga brevis TaxID=2810310 RepID=UPI001A967F9D|nr:sulfite exporter TauE/SafE family protein [Pedobacter sp. SYSU D00873]
MLLFNLFSYHLEISDILIILLVALLSGMSKTGVHGAGMLSVPLLAVVFGGQNSSGVMLPILLIADVIGVWYYHRHASVRHLQMLIPYAIAGIVAGTIIGKMIDDQTFRAIMAVTILGSIVIMVWLKQEQHKKEIPHNKVFAGTMGILGGFTSMVGNLAGSVMAVYLLAVQLPKNIYIGTTAWFFLIINWAKVPSHVFAWHTININTALLALSTTPAIVLGAAIGIAIVKRLSEEKYRWFIIVMTIFAAVLMVF